MRNDFLKEKPFDPDVLSHHFTGIVTKAVLKSLWFHDLRHTFVSFMLFKGTTPKVISEALSHSSVAFTMDAYSHIIEWIQKQSYGSAI